RKVCINYPFITALTHFFRRYINRQGGGKAIINEEELRIVEEGIRHRQKTGQRPFWPSLEEILRAVPVEDVNVNLLKVYSTTNYSMEDTVGISRYYEPLKKSLCFHTNTH